MLLAVVAAHMCFVPSSMRGAPATAAAPKGYTSRIWHVQDGLPESTVHSLAQTRDGYLWIGTTGGLVRFDGVAFTVFTRENTPALHDNTIFTLLAASDGGLWIGTTGGGLVRYRDREWTSYRTPAGLTNLFIRTIFEDSRRDLWVGTDRGLFRRKGERFDEIPLRRDRNGEHVHKVFEDSSGRMWAAGTGIYVRERGAASFAIADQALSELPFRSLAETGDGTVWAATVSGLLRLDRGAARFRPVAEMAYQMQTLHTGHEGSLWIGSIGKGIAHYEGGKFVSWSEPDAEPGSQVQAILEDAERNLWIGTQNGLVRWRPSSVEIIGSVSGMSENMRTVYLDPTGIVWAASVNGALYQVQGRALAPARLPARLGAISVRNVFRDRSGALWIGTDGDGAFCLRGNAVKQYRWRTGLPNDFIRAFAQAPDGTMWLGTDGGLAHITPEAIENIQPVHGLAYASIRSLHFDRTGILWIGTDAGLSRRNARGFIHDAIEKSMRDEKVWAIHEDPNGTIWLGTRGGGLFRVRNDDLRRFTTKDGLASNEIFQVIEDGHGNLWMNGPAGVSTISRVELEKTTNAARRTPSMHLFGVSDGMDTTQLSGGVQPGGCVFGGALLFPSARGVARFQGGPAEHERLPPALIDEVIADGRRAGEGNVVLGPGNGRLEIRYTAVALRSPERIHFRYKLDGIDQDWTSAQGARSVRYANLPPGRYVFRVHAFDVSAPEIVTEATVPMEWQPLLYQRGWFLALCALGVIAAAWLLHRSRLRREQQAFAVVLEERKRLAREMHDTLIQGCIGVSVLLEAAGSVQEHFPDNTHALVERAREQVRAIIDEARKAVWDLRRRPPETDTLATELERLAESVSAESGVPVRFARRGRVRQTARDLNDNLVLVVREALGNAIRHGRPGSVRLELGYGFRSIAILISDDGKGFTPPKPGARNSRHYGLIGMRERVEQLHGKFVLESKPGSGTAIRVRVPLARMKKKDRE